jgi:hypothetical protein
LRREFTAQAFGVNAGQDCDQAAVEIIPYSLRVDIL